MIFKNIPLNVQAMQICTKWNDKRPGFRVDRTGWVVREQHSHTHTRSKCTHTIAQVHTTHIFEWCDQWRSNILCFQMTHPFRGIIIIWLKCRHYGTMARWPDLPDHRSLAGRCCCGSGWATSPARPVSSISGGYLAEWIHSCSVCSLQVVANIAQIVFAKHLNNATM